MNYKEILYEHRGRAAWIYLNRPKAMNTITTVMALELENALTKAESDSNVRSLILSGKGQAFCAGADLKVFLATMNETEKLGPDFLDHVTVAMNHLRQFTKPVIVALNGLALAGGLELIMCCDIVFAVESAKLGDVHSNFGVFPGAGGAAVLPRMPHPRSRAKRPGGSVAGGRPVDNWGQTPLINPTSCSALSSCSQRCSTVPV